MNSRASPSAVILRGKLRFRGLPASYRDIDYRIRPAKHVERLMMCEVFRRLRFADIETDSKHNLPVAANLLDRNFEPEQPNAVWTSNITYIPTD